MVKCDQCQIEIPKDEDKHEHYGKILCEDCYMEVLGKPTACDPSAVASAMHARRELGQTGAEGLTKLQKTIYDYVKDKGEVEREELLNSFDAPPWEVEKQFAVLRHCELLKGRKVGNRVYMTLF